VPVTGAFATRGLGVLDLARAARTGRQPLASGELGYHVLDTMVAIDDAITEDRTVAVESRVDRVPLVAEDYDPFAATL
jgi:predicted dehydrogenase